MSGDEPPKKDQRRFGISSLDVNPGRLVICCQGCIVAARDLQTPLASLLYRRARLRSKTRQVEKLMSPWRYSIRNACGGRVLPLATRQPSGVWSGCVMYNNNRSGLCYYAGVGTLTRLSDPQQGSRHTYCKLSPPSEKHFSRFGSV